MREILFEVRRFDTKEVVGLERINENGHWEHVRTKRDEWLLGAITDGQEYSKFIRRQFTGLTDKVGMLIFEGDILQGRFSRIKVDFRQHGSSSQTHGGSADYVFHGYMSQHGYGDNYNERIVIGNIYSNPELL